MKKANISYMIAFIIISLGTILISLFFYPEWSSKNWYFLILIAFAIPKVIEFLKNWKAVFGTSEENRNRKVSYTEKSGINSASITDSSTSDVSKNNQNNNLLSANDKKNSQSLINSYYRKLANDCLHLPLSDVYSGTPLEFEKSILLSDVYINLQIVLMQKYPIEYSEEKYNQSFSQNQYNQFPIFSIFNTNKSSKIILLGSGGSGKTSFINYLTYLAINYNNLLPKSLQAMPIIRINFRDTNQFLYIDSSMDDKNIIWKTIEETFRKNISGSDWQDSFVDWKRNILNEPCLLLMDGLDEIPEYENKCEQIIETIDSFLATIHENSKIIITSRPHTRRIYQPQFSNFDIYKIAQFNKDQIHEFISAWYKSTQKYFNKWTKDQTNERIESLYNIIVNNEQYLELAHKPILLLLFFMLHEKNYALPKNRTILYESIIQLLLNKWESKLSPFSNKSNFSNNSLIIGLSKLAFETLQSEFISESHKENSQYLSRKSASIITKSYLRNFFCNEFSTNIHPDQIISFIQERAGLLIYQGENVFSFPHQTIHEYLASKAILEQDYLIVFENLFNESISWWREVFLFAISHLYETQHGQAFALIKSLCPKSVSEVSNIHEKDYQKAYLAAETIFHFQINKDNYFVNNYRYFIQRLSKWLMKIIENGYMSAEERLNIGKWLGEWGDNRKGIGITKKNNMVLPDIDWVLIPSGSFIYGESKSENEWLPDFWISRYPITNIQFSLFINDNGYTNDMWWSNHRFEQYIQYTSTIDIDEYRQNLSKIRVSINRNLNHFSADNRPATNISWFEAFAFTKWLNTKRSYFDIYKEKYKTESVIRLPYEQEWEKSMRGNEGKNPNHFLKNNFKFANTYPENYFCYPVGIFPEMQSEDYKINDSIGNIYEWTSSKIIHTSPTGALQSVLRGGIYDKPNVKLTYCQNQLKDSFRRSITTGFRVVFSIKSEDNYKFDK